MLKLLRDLHRQSRFLASKLFNEKTFYASFYWDLKHARKGIIIESPYLTVKRATYYAPLFRTLAKRKIKVRINARHPNCHDTVMKTQAEKAAQILLETGVKIYTYDDLRHWKLAIIDNAILWEGSLNILSHGRNREIMRRSASSYLCHKMIDFARVYH